VAETRKKRSAKVAVKLSPKVFIGIPTGPSKLYSTYYMVAALANLDWPNMVIHWAVTGGHDNPVFHNFRARLTKLMEAVQWPEGVTWTIHYVPLDKEKRFRNFGPILANKTVLRDAFLDSDADYFLLLGGDNPPPRMALKRLMKVGADVSIATCYQRPNVDNICGIYPLVWRYLWLPSELEQYPDIEPENREELRLAWLHCPAIINVSFDPQWNRKKEIWMITGGDGCALIKRKVLEMVDWGVTPDQAYHSEDVHFMSSAVWYGFTTACATDLHCPHMDVNGMVY